MEIKIQDLNIEQEKITAGATRSQEGLHANRGTRFQKSYHSSIKVPIFKPESDELELQLLHFQEICLFKGFDKQLWARKFSKFLLDDALKVVYSLDQADRQDCDKLTQTLLIRFNYTPAGK